MKKYPVLFTLFLIALSACWSAPNPSLLEPETPLTSNVAGYTGLQDETLEFTLSPTSNSKKPRTANAGQIKTSSLRAIQADFLDVPILKARVIAVLKGKILRPGSVATSTELTAIFNWSGDTPLTGNVTLSGFQPSEFVGGSAISSDPSPSGAGLGSRSATQTGQVNTTKTNQNAPGFTGNAVRFKIPGKFECVFASWNLSSGPFQYVQDQPLKLCKQPVKTDLQVTLTGPRAPSVGFPVEYEIKPRQLIQSAGVLNPKLKIFLPDHATFDSVRKGVIAGANPFDVQCEPQTPQARVIVCTGSSVLSANVTLVVRHTQALAETLRVELSSDTPERNPSDDTASLTVLPVIVNTATDLAVTGNTVTSSSVFVEDSLEQLITVTNLGPGVAVGAFIGAYQTGQAYGSIVPSLPVTPSGCRFDNGSQFRCPLPPLMVGESFTLTVPLRAVTTTNTGNKFNSNIMYALDTNNTNNFLEGTQRVTVARDPLKEHALAVQLTASTSVIEGQTHTSSVTVTNHGPNVATSRTLKFSPAELIPVTAPAGCIDDGFSGEILCDLSGMAANSSRTFVFSGTAIYQQWVWNLNVSASVTESGNDLNTYPQGATKYVSVQRDPNSVHSLGVAVTGLQASYFVGDAMTATATVTNYGPSASPPRELSIYDNGLTLNVPAGCNNEGWRIACPIPALAVNATWTQPITGTATTQTTNGSLEVNMPGHELETYGHDTSFYQSFPVRGYVGLLSASFTPAPPATFNIGDVQTFTTVITNSGQYTSVPDTVQVRFDNPYSVFMTGATITGLSACDLSNDGPSFRIYYCDVPAIPIGASYTLPFTFKSSNVAPFKAQVKLEGNNDRTGVIAYHEFATQNGLPLTLAWSSSNPLPASPPGFAFGQSYPFAVNITNPNTSSKSFSLEVSIPEGGYIFTLSGPASCTFTTNPATYSPGDYIDRIATCPVTLSAGQTSSVFFSANFPACDYDPPQDGQNCTSTVRNVQVKARVIGAVATPLSKTVKVNQ